MSIVSTNAPKRVPVLPRTMLVAYTTNHCKDLNDMDKVTKAVQDGVNVLIWSFIFFEVVDDEHEHGGNKDNYTKPEQAEDIGNSGQKLRIKVSQNIENYIKYKEYLTSIGYGNVVHLVAFGGWNGPHLPSGFSGDELYRKFKEVNTQSCLDKEKKFDASNDDDVIPIGDTLWDGMDWDIEGHDIIKHPNNEFTKECLDQMGQFSQLAKQDGLIVSMAPPESYLDTTTSKFSRFVNLTYPDDAWHQDFEYHGWNVYAYILAKYGAFIDFVFLQFYESYSHALYQTERIGITPSDFLKDYIMHLSKNNFSYMVDFKDDSTVELENQVVQIPLSKLVFGFANGWSLNSEKAIFFHPSEIKKAYHDLRNVDLAPRGCGYWVVEEEGSHGVDFTKELSDILFNHNISSKYDIKSSS